MDNIVLDILGKTSPGVRGLCQMDSFGDVGQNESEETPLTASTTQLYDSPPESSTLIACNNSTSVEEAHQSAAKIVSESTPSTCNTTNFRLTYSVLK